MKGIWGYMAMKGGRFLAGLFIICILHFVLPRLMPGSPVFTLLGPEAVGMSRTDYAELENRLGLHDPLWRQFFSHSNRLLKGDLGFSYYFHRPVVQVLKTHIFPTLALLFPSVLLSSVLAAVLGAVAGRCKGRLPDIIPTTLFLFLYAMPVFLPAMIGLDLFSFRLDLFPLGGLRGPDAAGTGAAAFLDTAYHLCLPVCVLTLSSTAVKYMVMRNSVADKRDQDYVVYARARGLKETYILFVHILRHACLPLISLVGLNVAFVLSGSLLVEIVFSINGMGALIYEAALSRDYPVLNACFLLLTVVVLLVNMVTDIACGFLDPRVRT